MPSNTFFCVGAAQYMLLAGVADRVLAVQTDVSEVTIRKFAGGVPISYSKNLKIITALKDLMPYGYSIDEPAALIHRPSTDYQPVALPNRTIWPDATAAFETTFLSAPQIANAVGVSSATVYNVAAGQSANASNVVKLLHFVNNRYRKMNLSRATPLAILNPFDALHDPTSQRPLRALLQDVGEPVLEPKMID